MNLSLIQQSIREEQMDGWLFFDHHYRDPLAYRILSLSGDLMTTRRWYYFIPAQGEPRKLVHNIESLVLDSLPGNKSTYSSWVEQQQKLDQLLHGANTIAMQYSPNCAIPYVSLVDAGTVELVRKSGVKVASSANLVQQFDSLWSTEQLEMHMAAGVLVDEVRRDAFRFVGEKNRSREYVSEFHVQQFMRDRFADLALYTDHGPIVAVNENASDPHYEPTRSRSSVIHAEDVLLIDCWAKLNRQNAVYYDVTWCGFCGENTPDAVNNVFATVCGARKAATTLVINRMQEGKTLAGFEVDDEARKYIAGRGFADFFTHRTGHSIGQDVHGTGANIDNYESHDDRSLLKGSCFSIEPGIYLPNFGIRSEINMFIGERGAFVTGEQQEKIVTV